MKSPSGPALLAPIIVAILGFFAAIQFGPENSSAQEPAQQQADKSHSITIFTGQCRLQIIEGFFSCEPTVIFYEHSGDKASVVFRKDSKIFTLESGADRQPNLENYYLSIKTIVITGDNKVITQNNQMEGEYHFSMNEDATKFYFIKCDVYNRMHGVTFKFYLEDIEKFERKIM